MQLNALKLFALIVITQVLGGCAAAAVGAGAAGAAALAADRRTAGTMIDDQAIELKAKEKFAADQEIQKQANINIVSFNGQVLLTGEAPSEAIRSRAVSLVQPLDKVKNVHNYVTIGTPTPMETRTNDAVITSKVKSKLVADEGSAGFHTKVVTENGVVYLMGIATPEEVSEAVTATQQVEGVQKVVELFERNAQMAESDAGDAG